MYDIKSIYEARNIPDAVSALRANPEAILICGGSDILIDIREGRKAGCSLVSIQGIKELTGVHLETDGSIMIRPATTFAGVTNSPIIQQYIPTLGYAVDQAGGPQLRNIGTIGGNVCNGVTSADSAPTLLTLNAELEITGPKGVRRLPLEHFYTGPGKVALEHAELLTAIRIHKKEYEGYGGHYIKFAQRNAMDIATLGCAVHVRLNQDKTIIQDVRIAFGVAGPTPLRCHGAEDAMAGRTILPALFEEFSTLALGEVNPRNSWRASKQLRVQLVKQLSARALKAAILAAGGLSQ